LVEKAGVDDRGKAGKVVAAVGGSRLEENAPTGRVAGGKRFNREIRELVCSSRVAEAMDVCSRVATALKTLS
jgi:hypothetical protein